MSSTYRVEIEFDERCYEALLAEADRLSVGIEQVIERAAAAWVTEIAESTSSLTCMPTATMVR